MHVFFYEAFEEEEAALRHYLPAGIEAGFTWKTIQEYGESTPPAPIISIRTQSQIPDEWAKGLTAILSRSTGYDHLTAYRKRNGAPAHLGFLPLYCHRAVAEQALLLWLALFRKLPQQIQQFRTFHRDGITGKETTAKTLLVVGVGNIGGEVVSIGKGLGMKVLCVDLVKKLPGETYVTAEEGMPQADVIVCAMNLTEENPGYFSWELLQKARPGAVFVNISRGELSPAVDLLRALETGILGGVGIDVYNHEKELAIALREGRESADPEVQALLAMSKLPNVICTPHNAFNSEEGVERKSEQSIQQVAHLLETGKFIWSAP